MEQIGTIAGIREAVAAARARGERVGFVPTMGFLHDGHLRLVDEARRDASCVVMSLFVNPTQFGPNEDFSRYPRDPGGDAAKARGRGVHYLFEPALDEMYPTPLSVHVSADDLPTRWEGAVRPGHFSGVLSVVAKLFNIVGPDVAVFGRKDFQQAALIRRMTRELNFPIDLVVAATVRERDGLAMSSRNTYLDDSARASALALVESLRAAARKFAAGERAGDALTHEGTRSLARHGEVSVDYFAVVDPVLMQPVDQATSESVAIVAARVGKTRLIDNMILGSPE
ncbi:MAG TPA: pantoate--beta-alanine ligase [Gemmatimonadaceae bacterium]|nr:pantoate--beta-alanine ligase [Gemmatimonadaceae bacterium]